MERELTDRSAIGVVGRPRLLPGLVLLLSLTAAVLVGRWVALDPELLHLEVPSSIDGVAWVVGLLALCVLLVRFPAVGLLLLVAFVYLNLSQVLVRYHGLPSFLQLLAAPLLIAAALGTWRDRAHHPLACVLTVALALHVTIRLLSSTVALDLALADERLVENGKAFMIYALVVSLAASRERIRTAAWALLGCGALLAVLNIFQALNEATADAFGGLARIKHAHIYGRVFEARIAGPLGDPNFFAQILLILVPVGLALGWRERTRSRKLVAYVLAACIGLAALLTYSRGGALALALVAFLALVARGVRPSRLVALIVVLGLVASLFPGSAVTRRLTTLAELLPGREVLHLDSSIEKRKLLGMVAWQMFLDHPLLGVGVGNFSTHYAPYSEEVGSESRRYVDPDERQYPHNLYLEIGAETGMVGVAGLILVIGAALSQLRIARERFRLRGDTLSAALSSAFSVAIAGFLISSLFLHGHFERYLWLLFAFSSALYSCARRPIHHGEPGRGSHP